MYLFKIDLQEFPAAHRMLDLPESKCKNLHGHNFTITITLGAEVLNQQGVVVDYIDAMNIFNHWIQEKVDHAVIVSSEDISLISFLKKEGQRFFILSSHKNTSVEIMAEIFFKEFSKLIKQNPDKFKNTLLIEVEVSETQKARACYGIYGSKMSGMPCHLESG